MSQDVISCEYHAAKARWNVVRMMRASGAGHLGGALSCIDIVTALYFRTMKNDPANPTDPARDRFVLSAGHKGMSQYGVLAEAGYFPIEELDTYGQLGSHIPGHPDMHKLPGIEANTGALGHGLSISLGMALGARLSGGASRVFTVLGDGELPEGSNWEAFAAAAHHRVDNLIAIIDDNGLQISGKTADVMGLEPIEDHLRAFGWSVRVIDGNDMEQVISTLDQVPFEEGKPSAIVAHTVKGKGISFAENQVGYHYWKPKGDELERAEAELEAQIAAKQQELVGILGNTAGNNAVLGGVAPPAAAPGIASAQTGERVGAVALLLELSQGKA
ncbi:MAG: transketolase [Propionibacteriaceae bacterium]|jgi:transketolase|nr:transketolase [Propionibacteriaceae bacterium]